MTLPFEFHPLPLPGAVLVQPRVFQDARGWFMETYKRSDFVRAGIDAEFRQDSLARSVGRGVVRGLHYQREPMAQGKLVRVPQGAVLDVIVDLRRGSPAHGRWTSVELSEENKRMLWVPPGFAHGYCALSDVTQIHYKLTSEYSPAHEGSIRWDDPDLAIPWPAKDPILSEKDRQAPLLRDADPGFVWTGP